MIGVVGAGAFGTALAVAWGRSAREVVLWGRNAEAMAEAATRRRLSRLPDIRLPASVCPTSAPSDLGGCDLLVVAVPMQRLSEVLDALPRLQPTDAVAACKGIDLDSLRGPTAILSEALPAARASILSGPSFARDIAQGLPTALSLGGGDAGLQANLSTPALRLYRTDDTRGVELGGALKNVIAIACGAAIGAGLGESARAALMTRGMAEMMRLATALGARRETLMGLSGLGDLALTCASPKSRNFTLGHALGQGRPAPDATTEGKATARAALRLAEANGIDMPVTRAVGGLVAGTLSVKDAIDSLLARELRTE
ncbi:MAG: NAD(P)H-dependent glycerol-3-phosphate dehydrogenase [Pseudomonadota bacterium]